MLPGKARAESVSSCRIAVLPSGTFLSLLAIVATFFAPKGEMAVYVAVALLWLVQDRRIERALQTMEP